MPMTGRDHARLALAAIRLVNGTMALLAPETMLRRLGAEAGTNQLAVYPLRMFGIRTVVLGVDLLAGGPLQQKGRVGVLIHATDAASAITAGLRRRLPARVALLAAGISVTNTALAAIIARPEQAGGPASATSPNGRAQPGAAAFTAPLHRAQRGQRTPGTGGDTRT
jgi:hypothetical protein